MSCSESSASFADCKRKNACTLSASTIEMALKLFFDAMSQPSRSVMLLLKCNNIVYTPKLINIASGEHLSNEFKEINPQGRVPAIDDNGYTLFESEAILKYLCATRSLPGHWYPTDQQARSKIDEYLSWHHTALRTGAAMTFRNTILIPRLTGKPPKDVSKYVKILNSSLDLFENYFLKNSNFISSDEISIADIMALTEISQLEVMGDDAPPLTPKVEEWKKRCIDATEPHYTDVHSVMYKVKKAIASSKL